LLEALFYYTNNSEFLVLTHNTPRMIVSVTKIAEVMWCFGKHSNGNLPTLIISVTAPTILIKLSPYLSQMRGVAVMG